MIPPPLVSIVMPNYNKGPFIREAIQSVVDQSHENWELIVVDNNSTDDSLETIRSYAAGDDRITALDHLSPGDPGAVRNTGLAQAKGEFLAFLDSDDLWLPSKLERQLAFMHEENAALCTTGTEIIDENGRLTGAYLPAMGTADWDQMLVENVVSTSAVMIDRRQCPDVAFPSLRYCQDYATWMGLVRQGHLVHILPEALARHRIRIGSFLPEKIQKARFRWRVYRDVLGLGLSLSFRCWCRYSLRGLRKSRGYLRLGGVQNGGDSTRRAQSPG
jgi:teichuronic acid biosynthesis glycosyltransferase TuaG